MPRSLSAQFTHPLRADDTSADASPDTVNLMAPVSALVMVRDSLHVLSAFAWGKQARLSKNKSAQMCDLLNAWN